MDQTVKVRENRARRTVDRRGYRLQKRRRIDPNAWDYGTYQIVDPMTNAIVWAGGARGRSYGYGLSLEDVEAWLREEDK